MSEEEKRTGENPQPAPDEEVTVGDVSASEPETEPEAAPADVTEEAPEEASEEAAAESPSEDVSEEPSDEPSEPEEASEEASEENPEETPEDVTEEAPEETSEEAPEDVTEKAAHETVSDDVEDEPAEEDDKKRKVIIGVSVVAAIIVVFIIVLLCLIGSCTHRHTMSYVEEVASTCETAGTVAHWHCDECGKDYADEAGEEELSDLALPLAAHTLSHTDEVPSTCVKAGTAEYWHCSVCNKNFADEAAEEELHDLALPLVAHTFVEDEYIAPTCTETGLSAGSHCSVCNEVFAEQQVIPALGHALPEEGVTITQEPTCTVGGSGTYECTRCHEVLETTVAALGHKEAQLEGKAPTCTEKGATGAVICTRCGNTLVESVEISELGHDPVLSEDNHPATCTEAGLEGKTVCSRCNEVQNEGTILEALGHLQPEDDSLIERVEPTCTQPGSESYTCVRCGQPATDVLEELGHDPVASEDNHDATCTEAGLEGKTVCTRCEEVVDEGTVIAPYGHTIVNNVCTVCNTPTSTGFEFMLIGGSYTLVGIGTCTDTDILIPDTYTDPEGELGALPVTGIANGVFSGAENIVSVSIPDTVTSVGSSVFADCTSLETVKFGAAVVSIGSSAFDGCTALTSVRIGTGEGWSVTRVVGAAGTPVDSEQLSDPAQAAVLFKETYLQYEWTKSTAVIG